MRLTHHRPRTPLLRSRRAEQEGGYILVMFALLLVPLLLLVGLSVDVGSWSNRSSDIQKAADAAALAGVVWLPDEAKATEHARDAAERNGFVHGGDISVDVERVEGTTRRLRVSIRDTSVGSFFYQGVTGREIDLARSATAEYVLPVPLGSPEDRFGTDPELPAAQRAGLWGNIHGPYTGNQKGDAYAAGCQGGTDLCGTQNSTTPYRPGGYLYTIDVPAGVTGMGVQVYDAGLYHRSAENVDTGDTDYQLSSGRTTTTHWTFYDQDPSELDVSDNPTAAEAGICDAGPGQWALAQGASASTYRNRWQTICRVDGTVPPGRYLLRVRTSGNGASANRYAIRIDASSATKPRIAAYGDMSMYNNIDGGVANFYLAEVDEVHAGKTLQIQMYDPGEVSGGNGTMKILAPGGAVAGSCVGSTSSPSSTFTDGATLSPCEFTTATNGSARYNGHWVTLHIRIPDDYECEMDTIPGCWWKVRYEITGQGNDTTTWSAQIVGDPVHLVEDY